ncbi:MAG: leucine-rich repeat domain-containing protein [Treponema sp.]|nr:leucine-rich repeat domain-containing protein [Treponema sp.]
MKKTNVLQILLGLSLISVFVSCQQPGSTPENQKKPVETISSVDLRNYDAKGNIFRAADNSEYEFFSKITDKYANFYRYDSPSGEHIYFEGTECPEWVLKSVTIEDYEDGIRVVYHRPKNIAGFSDRLLGSFNVTYIDGNGNNSTSTSATYEQMNDCWEGEVWNPRTRDTFSVDYPLVLPGKETYINVQYGYASDKNDNQFFLSFKVIPAHGKACVKDLPEKFISLGELGAGSADFVKLTDNSDGLILSVKNVIPPEGKNLRRSYSVIEADSNEKYFGDNWNSVGWVDEAVENRETSFEIDLLKFKIDNEENMGLSKSKNKPYIFCETQYSYELDEYPGVIFKTPLLKTSIIKSEKLYQFKSNEEEIDYLTSYGYMKELNPSTYELQLKIFNTVSKILDSDKDYTFVITDERPNVFAGQWKAFKNFTGKITMDLSKTKYKEIPSWGLFRKIDEDPDCFKNIVSVILPDDIEEIGDCVFNGTSITSFCLPETITRVGACIVPADASVEFADKDNWYWCWESDDDKAWTDKIYNSPKWELADLDAEPYTSDWKRYAKIIR